MSINKLKKGPVKLSQLHSQLNTFPHITSLSGSFPTVHTVGMVINTARYAYTIVDFTAILFPIVVNMLSSIYTSAFLYQQYVIWVHPT